MINNSRLQMSRDFTYVTSNHRKCSLSTDYNGQNTQQGGGVSVIARGWSTTRYRLHYTTYKEREIHRYGSLPPEAPAFRGLCVSHLDKVCISVLSVP